MPEVLKSISRAKAFHFDRAVVVGPATSVNLGRGKETPQRNLEQRIRVDFDQFLLSMSTFQFVHNCTIFLSSLDIGNLDD